MVDATLCPRCFTPLDAGQRVCHLCAAVRTDLPPSAQRPQADNPQDASNPRRNASLASSPAAADEATPEMELRHADAVPGFERLFARWRKSGRASHSEQPAITGDEAMPLPGRRVCSHCGATFPGDRISCYRCGNALEVRGATAKRVHTRFPSKPIRRVATIISSGARRATSPFRLSPNGERRGIVRIASSIVVVVLLGVGIVHADHHLPFHQTGSGAATAQPTSALVVATSVPQVKNQQLPTATALPPAGTPARSQPTNAGTITCEFNC